MSSARRCLGAIASRCANRRFLFTIGAVSIGGAKVSHIYANFAALSPSDVLRWGASFFFQDALVLLLVHQLLDRHFLASVRGIRIAATTLASLLVAISMMLASFNISFFIMTGAELHWRNIGLASDESSRKLLLTGLMSFLLVLTAIVLVSWVAQNICYSVMILALDLIKWPLAFAGAKISWLKLPLPQYSSNIGYDHLLQHNDATEELIDEKFEDEGNAGSSSSKERQPRTKFTIFSYTLIGVLLFALIFESLARPKDVSFTFMSWTLLLLPLVDIAHASPILGSLLPVYGTGINYSWDNRTALAEPIPLPWLPKEKIAGFEDWYDNKEHYRASADPARISNLDNDVIPGLRDKLADIDIRHVIIVKMESTRKDVFPVKKNDYIWKKLADSWDWETLPEDAAERLSTLTPTANFLTGDYSDGFNHSNPKPRGGLNFNNAFTTSTYTLKSLVGTLCGITPLVADFNIEIYNHFYQPCFPHILEAFNRIDHSADIATDNFTSFKWQPTYMQSTTTMYDKQDIQTPMFGFSENKTIHMEYLNGPSAKFKPNMENIHWFSMPEFVLEDYIKDAFQTAKQNNERLFLTHLTSTPHHPFTTPPGEEQTTFGGESEVETLSNYLNTVGYVDKWLKRILDVLEEQGVADETLLVLVGDHGLAIAENNAVTPYYSPNVANFRVPLVFSHPKLPPIDINDAVVSLQILPTILDLLIETGSLSESETKAARDLIHNYEGQSLLRPMKNVSEATGQPNWQFTVMNPGRGLLGVRDSREPQYRIVVPIVSDLTWRFTDLIHDPHEKEPVYSFEFRGLLEKIERKHGIVAAKWAEEAAFVSRYWIDENERRWQYNSSMTPEGYRPGEEQIPTSPKAQMVNESSESR